MDVRPCNHRNARGRRDHDVESIADSPGAGRFGFLVAFEDVIAHELEGRVAAFVERLGRETAIAEAIHEDREIVLVRAPSLTTATLEPIVARIWEASGRLN